MKSALQRAARQRTALHRPRRIERRNAGWRFTTARTHVTAVAAAAGPLPESHPPPQPAVSATPPFGSGLHAANPTILRHNRSALIRASTTQQPGTVPDTAPPVGDAPQPPHRQLDATRLTTASPTSPAAPTSQPPAAHLDHTTTTATTTTATTTTATTTTSDTSSLLIRPLQPSDEAVLRAMWLEGWEDTLVQFAPTMWDNYSRELRRAASTVAAVAAFCCVAGCAAALLLLPRQAAASPPLLGLMFSGVGPLGWGSAPGGSAAPALAAAAVASLPGWVLALVMVAALLAAGPALVPPQLRLAIVRGRLFRWVRKDYADMWSMGGFWDRAAAGREYWVAQLQPGGRVVGGVALKVGAGVRPLAAAALNVKAGGGGGGPVAAVLPGEPAENEAGFTESDVRGHGPLEGGDALVYRMATDKTVRRCGVGRRLMEAVMERAEAAGVRRVLLATANAEAIKFYRACGFEPRPPAVAGQGGGGSVLWRSVGGKGGGE